jgi:hypothetical protein
MMSEKPKNARRFARLRPWKCEPGEADTNAIRRDAGDFGHPCLASRYWECACLGVPVVTNLTDCQWRIYFVAREHIDETNAVLTRVSRSPPI